MGDSRALRGIIQDDEMWTSGMQAALDVERRNISAHKEKLNDVHLLYGIFCIVVLHDHGACLELV
jgi:hypothetical protein